MVTILFGAGASFGSGSCSPYSPPLGKDLFFKLNEQGGYFSKLNDDIKEKFIHHGFEEGMASIEDNSQIINPMQKEIACYLSKFMIKNDNAYARLFNKLKSYISKVTIVTLNYDLLIEQALTHCMQDFDYNGDGNGVRLLKLHGSSNFLPQLPPNIVFSGTKLIGCETYFEGLETHAAADHSEIVKWSKDPKNSDLSPVLALYQKGKRVVINNDLIINIQSKYVETIKHSSLIFVVGVKYVEHDKHIWEYLASTGAKVVVIDPYPNDTLEWASVNSLNNVEVITSGFESMVLPMSKRIKLHIMKASC